MKFAVFTSGGKQYKVSEGDVVELERLSSTDKKINFENVLLYADGESIEIGKPYAHGAKISATILEDIRGEKIRVAKYKAKVRYRRVNGHRQALTRIKIDSISIGEKPKAMKEVRTSARTTAKKAKE
jgi:large subunit ribosomal protein L21